MCRSRKLISSSPRLLKLSMMFLSLREQEKLKIPFRRMKSSYFILNETNQKSKTYYSATLKTNTTFLQLLDTFIGNLRLACHWISHLIIQHGHQIRHQGVAATVAKKRTKYWITRAHDLVKSIKFRCLVCREIVTKVESQINADLPQSPLAPFTPLFHYTSCDYFDPYRV